MSLNDPLLVVKKAATMLVVNVQAAKLDMEYLRNVCAARGVAGYLERLLAQ